MNVYYICKRLIEKDRTAGLPAKLDLYLAMDRITAEQYSELMEMLPQEAEV